MVLVNGIAVLNFDGTVQVTVDEKRAKAISKATSATASGK